MPCYVHIMDDGTPMHLCGDLGPHCADCADVAANLCDYPVGNEKTCDRNLCERHSHTIGEDLHYCATHHAMWEQHVTAGYDLPPPPAGFIKLIKND